MRPRLLAAAIAAGVLAAPVGAARPPTTMRLTFISTGNGRSGGATAIGATGKGTLSFGGATSALAP